MDYIRYNGGQAERINTMGRPVDTRKTFDVAGCQRQVGTLRWGKSTSTPGSADISATIAGRSVKIEGKIGHDRQSEAQRRYQASIARAGGLYFIAKDFTSFIEWYGEIFNRA